MAQRGTTKSTKGGSANRNSGRGTTSRNSASGRSRTSRSTSSRSSRNSGGRSSGGGNGGGMMILLKAFLFVIAIALVFGLLSWGLEKMGERGKKNDTVTPTAGAETPGATADPSNPTDTPTPTPEPTLQDNARKVMQSVSKSKLKLSKEFSEYRAEIDDYTSIIKGTECVGVNVLESTQLVGIYWVAVDGSVIFRELENGEFETIEP